MIDTHAHLDVCASACAASPDELVGRAAEAGVTRIITVGSDIESCKRALAFAERYEGVFAILGIHPHEAGGDDASRLPELRQMLSHERAVAVGEIGLDFYRDYAPRARQQSLFEAQLELAGDLAKPVVIHTRAAEDAVATTLAQFAGRVVLHCFSSPELLPSALERDYYVSFAGNVTYPKADDLRAAAARIGDGRLLAETDSPYLAPQPRRGRPNEPANVVHTLAVLAEIRGEQPPVLERRIEANAREAFSLP